MSEQTEERDLDIEEIRLDPRIRSRRPYGSAQLESDMRKYMRLYDVLPPVVVYQERDGTYVLSDGHLRLEAARRLGRQRVRARLNRRSLLGYRAGTRVSPPDPAACNDLTTPEHRSPPAHR